MDMGGNVVGVVFAGRIASAYGFIVPLKDVKDFLKEYLSDGYRERHQRHRRAQPPKKII